MATIAGTRITLSDTVGLAVDMSPTIELIDPYDVGILSYFGMSSLEKECTETEHKWMEDTLRPLTSTITDNPLTNVATTINVAAGTGVYYRAGDVVKIEDELIRLSADPSTDALTTIASPNGRGFGGSTAAQHAQNSVIEIVSVTYAEGWTTPGLARTTVKTSVSNYTQIFEDVVQVSTTLEAVEQWAPGSEYARQLAKTMKTLMILMDKTFIYGKPAARAAANGNTGALGGIRHFITTNVTNASGAQLSEKLLLDQLNLSYEAGGNPRVVAFRLKQKQAFNKFLDPARRTAMSDRRAGAIVDSFEWDNGIVDTLVDRWLPADEMLNLDSEYIGFGPLRGQTIGHEILPKTSRGLQKGEISG
ncbi:MAG TPA: DUF5309 family protein, partial [Candidatus Limnocylindrales bacterium]